MEKLILAVSGIAAVCFVGYRLWQKAKGELPCNCGRSCSENKKDCLGKVKQEDR